MEADSSKVDLARLGLGSFVAALSIVALLVGLWLLIGKWQPAATADIVAVLGTMTTFLGLAVGLVFGVNATSAAHAQSAAAMTQASQAAGKVADAANATAASARQVGEAARQVAATSQALARDLSARNFGAQRALVLGEATTDDAEDFAGDPDDEHTRMVLSSARSVALESLTRDVVHIANPAPARTLFAGNVLAVALAEADANVSRATNRARVTEYLNLLGFDFLDVHGVPTRYCAAGLTWATCKAYADLNGVQYSGENRLAILRSVLGDVRRLYFKPSAGCQAIMDDARARGAFLSSSETPQPGYLVFYNWEGGSHAEHIGIVEAVDAGSLRTVEFNTRATAGPNQGDGGAVARKVRPLKFVLGYVRTY